MVNIFIGGIPQEEYIRLCNLPIRRLAPSDVPSLDWNNDEHALCELMVRKDGAIINFLPDEEGYFYYSKSQSQVVGYINNTGGINWFYA